MSKRISQEVRQQVFELLQKGLRYRSIARILNISCSTIKRWQGYFDRGHIDWVQARPPRMTSEIAQSVVERYLETGSFLQAAKEFGLSDRSVYRYYMNILNRGQPLLLRGRKTHNPNRIRPMSQHQKEQSCSYSKPRTSASYEKEIRELNILIDSLLVSMEQNLEGVKKSP